MKGWIIDCYPDYEHDCIVIWIKTHRGIERLVDKDFFPKFYVHAPEEKLTKLAAGRDELQAELQGDREKSVPGRERL